MLVGVVAGRVILTVASPHAPAVVVGVVAGGIVLPVPVRLNLRPAVAAVIVHAVNARQGDPALQGLELELTSDL